MVLRWDGLAALRAALQVARGRWTDAFAFAQGVMTTPEPASEAPSTSCRPEVFIQLSRFRDTWLRWRWGLWLIATAFAAAITHLLTAGGMAGSAG